MFKLPIPQSKSREQKIQELKEALAKEEGELQEKGKKSRKKKEPQKPWTYKERIFVAGVLAATIVLGVYFWLKGSGQVPDGTRFQFNLPGFSFEETVIVE